MATQYTHANVQAIRRSTKGRAIHIVCHSDASLERDILLWDDIITVFSTALYARSGTVVLPFLKGPNFKNLDPLRIAAVPGVTLDIVVGGQSSDKAPPETPQENKSASAATTPDTVTSKPRRNPAGGLVEKAMDAYRDNENPAFGPRPRGPQAILDDTPLPLTSNSSPTSQTSISSSVTLSHQDPDSTNSNDLHNTMEKVKLGDKDAQRTLGSMYQFGDGVQQDYQAALDWYIKAANQGHVEAQNFVGHMHRNGLGVSQDYDTAMKWYRKAAHQGFASAQYNVGYLYEKGLGVPQDYHQAMEWYQKAASQGNASAYINIGYLYIHGLGVSQDYSQAIVWYRLAAEQGSAIAQHNLAYLYEHGRGAPKDLTTAIEWYTKSAGGGDADSKEALRRIMEQQKLQSNRRNGETQSVTKKSGIFKRPFN